MANQQAISQSFQNLFIFEFFSFRKSFSQGFIIVGLFNIFHFSLLYFYLQETFKIFGTHLPLIRFILFLLVFIYLYIMVRKIRSTRIEDGTVFFANPKIGEFLLLITFLIVTFGDFFLYSFFEWINFYPLYFLASYVNIILILVLYYFIQKYYFPEENTKQIMTILISLIFLAIVSFLSVFSGNYLIISDEEPFQFLRSIFFSYFIANGILGGIILMFFGFFEFFTAKYLLRNLNG